MYYLYILRCSDQTLYTGVTTNVPRRVREHNSSARGAKYTHSRRPVALAFSKKFRTRSRALKKEYQVKRLTRKKKLALIREAEKRRRVVQ
jgi:putative endonuclease